MRHDRRGLTVIELVLILLAVGLIIFFLLRLRGDDAAPVVPPAADSAALPSTAAAPLVDRLDLATPIDSVAAAGDTIVVRYRATGAGAGVARATIDLAPDAGSVVLPTSLVTNDIGEASVQWIVAADTSAGPTRTLRATVRGNPSATLETSVRVAPAAVPDAR